MSNQLPVAVINGIEKFGAKQLAQWLIKNDIEVVGVGEYVSGWGEMKNFEFRNEIDEVTEKADYWFDFEKNEKVWKRAGADKSRLTIVGVNRSVGADQRLKNMAVNWRIVNVHGVYGEGMDENNDKLRITNYELEGNNSEVGYLIRAIKLAVGNKNLILPPRSVHLRLVAADDFKEAVLRASFLSGTEKEVFEIWGRAISSEDIAKVLIEEGKMTRFKVEEEGVELDLPEDEEVAREWGKLKWQPTVELGEGVGATMQYFFSKVDEENRKKKTNVGQTPHRPVVGKEQIPPTSPLNKGGKKPVEEAISKRRYEVVVEKEEKEIPFDKGDLRAMAMPEEEIEVVEKEEFEEIKPILVKKEIKTPLTPLEKGGPEQVKGKIGRKKDKFSLGKYGGWVAGGLAAALVLWGIWGLWRNYQMLMGVKTIKNLVLVRKYLQATQLINNDLALAKKEDGKIENWGINKWVWGRRYQTVLKVLEEGLAVGSRAVDLSQRSEDINGAIFNDKAIDWKRELAAVKEDLASGSDDLGVLQARLSGDWSWVPEKWKGELTTVKQQLNEVTMLAGQGRQAVEILPSILGTDGGKRDFMVLLQNESELRAGGGFIGSWAVLSFENGALTNFDIKDIYEADGQLKGHVEPPLPIKNFLGEASWYMRDANWQADFPAAARDIQWFLDKETGRKVDGVIGLDLAVAKAILGVIGEVYVPDFKEKINKDNIYEQAEFYAETNSFAGSSQKASFLGALGRQLFEGVKNLSAEKRLVMVRAILGMLQQNEIQIALNDKTAARVAAEAGWDGAIYDGKCSKSNCFTDYLYIVESNFGVNKANYFLRREINETVNVSPAAIGRVIKINYENTAKNNNWPGGDYKDYVRIYIPVSSNLAEVSLADGSGVKTVVGGNDLSVNRVGDKKEVGFLAIVPVGQKRTVTVSYSDQIDLSKANNFSYLNYIQKQPGFGNTPLATLVSMPEGWQPTGVEPTASMVNGKLLFNLKLDQDVKMGVEMGK